jgi:hypothetical protein
MLSAAWKASEGSARNAPTVSKSSGVAHRRTGVRPSSSHELLVRFRPGQQFGVGPGDGPGDAEPDAAVDARGDDDAARKVDHESTSEREIWPGAAAGVRQTQGYWT